MNDKQINQYLRRRFSTVGWALIIYSVLMYALVYMTIELDALGQLVRSMADRSFVPDVEAINSNAWGYIAAILVGAVILHGWKGSDFWRYEILAKEKRMTTGVFFAILVLTIGAQLVSSLWVNLVEMCMNLFDRSIIPELDAISGVSTTLSMFLYSSIVGPVGEELLFRGYVLRSLRPYGKRFAITLSALLFALFHGNLLQLPYAFVMGLLMGYVAAEYSFGWAVAVHMFNNLVLADLFPRLTAGLSDEVYYFLDGSIFLGCAFVSLILLLVNNRKIQAYRRSEWMDRRCLKCFFTSPGVIALMVIMVFEMLQMFL